jgi:hypothetical protein
LAAVLSSQRSDARRDSGTASPAPRPVPRYASSVHEASKRQK